MKQINNISSLLRKWLSGDKNAEQTLRNAAQEDVFLRDAVEGFDQFTEENHQASVERLRGKIAARTKKSKRRTLIWYLPRAAAASIVLLVGTWFIQQQFPTTNPEVAMGESAEQNIAQPETYSAEPDEASTVAPSSASESVEEQELEASEENVAIPQPSTPPATSKPSITRAEPKEKVKPSIETAPVQSEYAEPPQRASSPTKDRNLAATTKPSPPPIQEEIQSIDVDPTPSMIADDEIITPEEVKQEKIVDAGISAAGLRQANPAIRLINGIVIDASGEPLIGAMILESGTSNGVATDIDGKFKLEVQAESKQLEVAYVGFTTQQIDLGNQTEIEIQLEENGITLDEVVVVDYKVPIVEQSAAASTTVYSKRKKSKKERKLVPTKVSREFKRFVKKNKNIPDAAKENNIKGEVILEFDITQEGRPNNFRTIKSLGYGCDEEAIRLLKEGPAWKTNGSQKGRVGIKF